MVEVREPQCTLHVCVNPNFDNPKAVSCQRRKLKTEKCVFQHSFSIFCHCSQNKEHKIFVVGKQHYFPMPPGKWKMALRILTVQLKNAFFCFRLLSLIGNGLITTRQNDILSLTLNEKLILTLTSNKMPKPFLTLNEESTLTLALTLNETTTLTVTPTFTPILTVACCGQQRLSPECLVSRGVGLISPKLTKSSCGKYCALQVIRGNESQGDERWEKVS